ncbi:UV excision repair protein RAD23 -like protein B [Halotydeus destructor]|nr:UV excision repair protein RAD23 -like protein B [Halotydeus destructor]
MKITVKNLHHQSFTVDIDDNLTVSELKKQIEEVKGSEYAVANQKLIYSGKILEDANVISSYNIEESKFVVVMVTKPKSVPQAVPEAPAPVVAEGSSTPAVAVEPSKSSTETSKPATAAPVPTPAASGFNITQAESSLVLGADYESTISKLCEMGYPRSEVEKALRASFNNPDRAVEYLISGIPEQEAEASSPARSAAPEAAVPQAPAQAQPRTAAVPASGQAGGNPLEFLRTQPQFAQMREVIRQNPALLATVMQEIGNSNPQLLRVITENQEQFVQMLNEPPTDEEAPAAAGAGGPDLSTYMGSASVTPEDKQAIERLKQLGFDEYLVVQAYFACDKNENMAADFLFSQGEDD